MAPYHIVVFLGGNGSGYIIVQKVLHEIFVDILDRIHYYKLLLRGRYTAFPLTLLVINYTLLPQSDKV